MIRIGVRAHDFGRFPAEELARRIADKGISCVQLALNKAIEGLDLKNGDLNPGLAWWDPLESTCRHASLSIL